MAVNIWGGVGWGVRVLQSPGSYSAAFVYNGFPVTVPGLCHGSDSVPQCSLAGVQLPGGHMYTSQDGIVYVLMSRSDIQCIDYLFFPESAFFNMHQLTKRVCVEGISMATSQQQKALTAFLGGFWFAMP